MKFAVMGAGEYGSKYGGWLVNAGLDVTFQGVGAPNQPLEQTAHPTGFVGFHLSRGWAAAHQQRSASKGWLSWSEHLS